VTIDEERLETARAGSAAWRRWGEDGIAGICDDRQQLCFALAMCIGADSILKQRMFGLSISNTPARRDGGAGRSARSVRAARRKLRAPACVAGRTRSVAHD
jgi:hypothetical protein